MLVQLLGVGEPMDFISKKDNKRIQGFNFYVAYEDSTVNGLKADSKFITPDLSQKINVTPEYLIPFVGEVIDIQLDFKGKLLGVKPLPAEVSVKG